MILKWKLRDNFIEISDNYCSKKINYKKAIKNIMSLGFFKKEAKKIFENYYGY